MRGIYRYIDLIDDEIVYVGMIYGKSSSFRKRMRQHEKTDSWTRTSYYKIEYVDLDDLKYEFDDFKNQCGITSDEIIISCIESYYIKLHTFPKYNKHSINYKKFINDIHLFISFCNSLTFNALIECWNSENISCHNACRMLDKILKNENDICIYSRYGRQYLFKKYESLFKNGSIRSALNYRLTQFYKRFFKEDFYISHNEYCEYRLKVCFGDIGSNFYLHFSVGDRIFLNNSQEVKDVDRICECYKITSGIAHLDDKISAMFPC